MNRNFLAAVLLLGWTSLFAQHQELDEKAAVYKSKSIDVKDSTSLLSAFKNGNTNGHFRYFFMGTQNESGLDSYFANAVGGGLRYETNVFNGFQFALSGFYTYNLGSSDLGKMDSSSGQSNRYELALFDVQNPSNKNDINRLEELYLSYQFRNSKLTFGKQLLNTPFINLQDGRMRPTGVEGFWMEINELKKIKFQAGWLYALSPRGTTKWFKVQESIGVYGGGVAQNGNKSDYASNLKSLGIGILSSQLELSKGLKIQIWDIFTENIFNTFYIQSDFQFMKKREHSLSAGIQFIHQDGLAKVLNIPAEKIYFEPSNKAIAYGAMLSWKNKRWETSFNFNHITSHGRYLMPREWGREPFFTFLPRERNEGLGDVYAYVLKTNYQFPKSACTVSLAAGYYQLPDVTNFRLNKYGMPSYTQLNASIQHKFRKAFERI